MLHRLLFVFVLEVLSVIRGLNPKVKCHRRQNTTNANLQVNHNSKSKGGLKHQVEIHPFWRLDIRFRRVYLIRRRV